MHETLKIDNWQEFYEKFTSTYVDGSRGRFLIRRSRIENCTLDSFLNDLAKAYKKAQAQYEKWKTEVWRPLLDQIQERSINDKTILHAFPTHDYSGPKNKWWQYEYSKSPAPYGWGYSFKWLDSEPVEKINYDLGQKLYDLDNYQNKFNNRIWVLERLLKQYLMNHLNSLFDRTWVTENLFSDKIVKFTLQGDEYWYRIAQNKYGVPVWENFIWQSNKTISINL